MKNLLFVIALLTLLESTTLAGTKQDSTVLIRNNSTLTAAVIVDPPSTLPANPTQQQFINAGGKILNPGAETSFKVKSGSHTVIAQLIDNAGAQVGARAQQSVTTTKNQTLRLQVTGTAAASISNLP